jgi:cysteine desulfurase family protein
MIYLDNAATSWPKPESVLEATSRCLRDVGASSGRSAHRWAQQAERIRLDAREAVAELFGVSDPMRVVFTLNATTAINIVLFGLLRAGDDVVTSDMEHNAVARPLHALAERGVSVSVVPCGLDGALDAGAVEQHLRPNTRLVVINHASNVCGTVQPVREIAARLRPRGIPMLVDAAQTGGCWPVDLATDGIDLLAFSGHKGLLGPTGVGGLAIADGFDVGFLPPLVYGGTGSRSDEEIQPDVLPDKYEAGTPNLVGLAGLAASVRYVLGRGVREIREHEQRVTRRLLNGLAEIPGLRVFGAGDHERQTAVVAFTTEACSVSDAASRLDEDFGILCRAGLHCAPHAHRTLGTFPHGAIRFSAGAFTTIGDAEHALKAVAHLAAMRHG